MKAEQMVRDMFENRLKKSDLISLARSRGFTVEAKSLSVTFSRKDEETVRAALEKLRPQRDFRIEEDRA